MKLAHCCGLLLMLLTSPLSLLCTPVLTPHQPRSRKALSVSLVCHCNVCSLGLRDSTDKFDKSSNWWIHCLTGNYLSRWYRFTIGDVKAFQVEQETKIFEQQKAIEAAALEIYHARSPAEGPADAQQRLARVKQVLGDFHEQTSTAILNEWWDFFFVMAGKYRDMYKIVDMHVDNFAQAYAYLTVPRSWMELVGYWGAPGTPAYGNDRPVPAHPVNVPSEDSLAAYQQKYPHGPNATYSWPYSYLVPASSVPTPVTPTAATGAYAWWLRGVDVLLGVILGLVIAVISNKVFNRNTHMYLPVN